MKSSKFTPLSNLIKEWSEDKFKERELNDAREWLKYIRPSYRILASESEKWNDVR